jgi:AcrR family transcriptional regulator
MARKKEDNRIKILETARELFYMYGYSKVTMDDISRKLGMSKKTLYNYYEGKYQLLQSILENFKTNLAQGVESVLENDSMSYPEKLYGMLTQVAMNLSRVSPKFMEDIQLNAPEIWKEINEYKKEAAFLRFNKLIEEGLRKGHVRKDINKNMAIALYVSAIQNLLDPVFMQQLPREVSKEIPEAPIEIFDQMINIIYEGILSEDTKAAYRHIKE